jgi:hypothetical protein
MRRFIGIDLAWARTGRRGGPNETGVAVIDGTGTVLACGWTRGVEETIAWMTEAAVEGSPLAFVDAPLAARRGSRDHCACPAGTASRPGGAVSCRGVVLHSKAARPTGDGMHRALFPCTP